MIHQRTIIWLPLCALIACLTSCMSHDVQEAQQVIAQADSLRAEGKMYGVDEGDSLSLAQACERLGKTALTRFVYPTPYAHACYHYGRLLREKDNPVAAMQCFINATHTRTRDSHILGRAYSNMGSICHLAGEYQLSYDMYERSADMFLQNGDTINYFYALNDMAFELAQQGKKEKALNELDQIRKDIGDSYLEIKIYETMAIAYQEICQYDSTIFYARKVIEKHYATTTILLATAQAYYYLAQYDSALVYANEVISSSDFYGDIYNALYIISHEDSTLTKEEILQLTSQREDIRFEEYEPQKEKLSYAVLLLEKDINYSPDLTWLYVLIATLFVVIAGINLYVIKKRRKHALISQQVNSLLQSASTIREKHDALTKNYQKNSQRIKEDINYKCSILCNKEKIVKTLAWKHFDKMCMMVDKQFYLLATKLQNKQILNEVEIRLCVLTLLNCSYDQMAELLYRSHTSIGTLKMRVAKKLGTTSLHLRLYLIEKECIN